MIEEELVGWHHQFNGYDFVQALGVGEDSLECLGLQGDQTG